MRIKFYTFIFLLTISCISFGCNDQQKTKNTGNMMVNKIDYTETDTKDKKSVNSDIQQILQKSINLPQLQQYYHIDTNPNRSPLVILTNDKFPKDLSIEKFEKKVLILSEDEIKKQNKVYLEFSKIEIEENTALIEISYAIEGIACKIQFIKKYQEWSVKNATIIEK